MKYNFFVNQSNVKGVLKERPEDFIVCEITKSGEKLKLDSKFEKPDEPGNFTVIVLQKRNWDTVQALFKISKLLHRGKKAFSFAGTKDKRAVTVQLASFYKVEKQKFFSLSIKDIKINGAWYSQNPLNLGDLLGNSFEISVKILDENEGGMLDSLEEFQELQRVPNYFGEQRFGFRGNNFNIGILLLKKEFEKAVMEFLCSTENEKNKEAIEARKRLLNENDFSAALEYFPKYLRNERNMLFELSKNPKNFVGAFRRLPRSIRLIFIHSVQARLFNEELDARVKSNDFSGLYKCPSNFYGFPDSKKVQKDGDYPLGSLIGYETQTNSYEDELLSRYGISKGDFLIKEFPELSQKGTLRPFIVPVKDFSYSIKEDPEEKSAKKASFTFDLPNGSYATTVLSQFFDFSDQ